MSGTQDPPPAPALDPGHVREDQVELFHRIHLLHESLEGLAQAEGLPWWQREDLRAFDRVLGMFAGHLLTAAPMEFHIASGERLATLRRGGI